MRNLTPVWRLMKTQFIHLATTVAVPHSSTWTLCLSGAKICLWNPLKEEPRDTSGKCVPLRAKKGQSLPSSALRDYKLSKYLNWSFLRKFKHWNRHQIKLRLKTYLCSKIELHRVCHPQAHLITLYYDESMWPSQIYFWILKLGLSSPDSSEFKMELG